MLNSYLISTFVSNFKIISQDIKDEIIRFMILSNTISNGILYEYISFFRSDFMLSEGRLESYLKNIDLDNF